MNGSAENKVKTAIQFYLQVIAGIGVVVVICLLALITVRALPAILSTAWRIARWIFFGTVGMPFWWMSSHTGATPFSPGGVMAMFALFCILCVKTEDFFDTMIRIGCGYGVLFLIGFIIRVL